MDAAARELAGLARRIRRCVKCRLCKGRTHAVPGEGDAHAVVFLIGEAPGRFEDRTGWPFVGPSGRFLTSLLEGIGLSRPEVFITSCVKCRPPQNRPPRQDELAACQANWLARQLELVNPRVVLLLGSVATKVCLGPGASLARLHGRAVRRDGRLYVVQYHPAAGMRFPAIRRAMASDFTRLGRLIRRIR